ncbi:MAG: hypothetical protein WDW38_004465 [Sanguina aurantia]
MSFDLLHTAKNFAWRVGAAFRESGQALERTGFILQGCYSFEENISRHMPLTPMRHMAPEVEKGSFVAPSGMLAGNVTLGKNSSIWYHAMVRGDGQTVSIGNNTNIQDSVYVGAVTEFSPPVVIGNNVSVGHGAILKGCTIGDNCLIGIGAVVSEGVEVEAGSIVAAGAYVVEDTHIPAGELWVGSPAYKLRDVKPQEIDYLKSLPVRYVELAGQHQAVMQLLRDKQAEYIK